MPNPNYAPSRWRRVVALVAAIAAALAVLAACGNNDNSSASSGSTTTSSVQPPQMAVTAKDFSFEIPSTVLPAHVPGGVVQITLTNAGSQPHDFQLATVDGSHTKDEIVKTLSNQDSGVPTWLHGVGGVGTVGPGAPPGVAYVKLDAGKTYWYFCTETTDDNKAHAAMGMIGQFTTEGQSPVAELPNASATVTAREYTFDVKGVKAGEQLVRFTNSGPNQLHHFIAFPIQDGKSISDVQKALAAQTQQSNEPPPVDFEKGVGVAALDPGRTEVAKLSFQRGRYAFVCFMTDHAGGPPHVAKGMIVEYDVA